MELSAIDKERNRQQFDSFCKMVLRGEAASCRKDEMKRTRYEIALSELTQKELNSLFVIDEYSIDMTIYTVLGFDVKIRDDLISDALGILPQRKRDVILLSFFLDMNDREIARLFHNTPANIHYHRTSALELLKAILQRGESR